MIQGQGARTADTVGQYTEAARERLEDGLGRAREGLSELDVRARSWFTNNPVLAVACAVGIGYFVGRLARR